MLAKFREGQQRKQDPVPTSCPCSPPEQGTRDTRRIERGGDHDERFLIPFHSALKLGGQSLDARQERVGPEES